MTAGRRITRAYVRHYTDNGQTTAYVEWSDGSRTESSDPNSLHMAALLRRAKREGLTVEQEEW